MGLAGAADMYRLLTKKVNASQGAPMGRPNVSWYMAKGERIDIEVLPNASPFYLTRIHLDSGGYDPGGAYWGLGEPLYGYVGPLTDIRGYVRAVSREGAKGEVRKIHPYARFFR